MRKNAGKKSPRPSSSRQRYGRIAAVTQVLLFATFSAIVTAALVVDTRFYYGIDVYGQPIYKELEGSPGSSLPIHPAAQDETTSVDGPAVSQCTESACLHREPDRGLDSAWGRRASTDAHG